MKADAPLLLTVREAASLAGVSLTLAYRMTRCGEWPTVRVGLRRRGVRVPAEGLRAWIAANTEGGLASAAYAK
jgi:excisionase family DNA binding protein